MAAPLSPSRWPERVHDQAEPQQIRRSPTVEIAESHDLGEVNDAGRDDRIDAQTALDGVEHPGDFESHPPIVPEVMSAVQWPHDGKPTGWRATGRSWPPFCMIHRCWTGCGDRRADGLASRGDRPMIHRRGLVRPRSGRDWTRRVDQPRTLAGPTSVPNRAARRRHAEDVGAALVGTGAWTWPTMESDTGRSPRASRATAARARRPGCAPPGRSVAGDRGAGDRRPPGAVRPAHRLGQVGGLLHRHRLAARSAAPARR